MSPPDVPHLLVARLKILLTSTLPPGAAKVSLVPLLLLQVEDVVDSEGQRSAPARGVLFAHIIPRHLIRSPAIPETPTTTCADAPSTIAPRLRLARGGAGATLFNDPEDCGLAAFDW